MALHEISHATAHPKRLNRYSKTAPFGSPEYAQEEFIGEIASAFLTAELGIPNVAAETQAASYLASWLVVLKSDSRAIINASFQASRAADYVLTCSGVARREDETIAQAK